MSIGLIYMSYYKGDKVRTDDLRPSASLTTRLAYLHPIRPTRSIPNATLTHLVPDKNHNHGIQSNSVCANFSGFVLLPTKSSTLWFAGRLPACGSFAR